MICVTLPEICGFNKSSEAGPDSFAPSIFLKNCQLRCPYCMNSRLVNGESVQSSVGFNDVEAFVRENNCKWVGISGGEPLNRSIFEILSMFAEIKKWDCKIALSTNGLEPDKMALIMPYVDYVTLDIKTDKERYDSLLVSGACSKIEMRSFDKVFTTLNKIRTKKHLHSQFDFEVRSTLYPPLMDEQAIRYIGKVFLKGEKWMLQPFRKTKNMLSKGANDIAPYGNDEIKRLASVAMEYTDNVHIREV